MLLNTRIGKENNMDNIEIKKWFGRIQRAEDLQATKHNERKQISKLYTGEFFGSPFANQEEISEVNFVYEYLQILVSAIYARNPHIFCRTKNPRLGQFAETMETVVNHYWYDKQAKQKIKKAIIDAILAPPGFIEIGYFFFSESSRAKNEIEKEFPELKDLGKKKKTEEEQGITDETIREDDVFLSHLSSWDVLFPDGYHDIRECPYIIKRQGTTLDKLLANPFYKSIKERLSKYRQNANRISPVIAYNMRALPKQQNSAYNGIDDELVPITLYHIFDKMDRKIFTLAKDFDEDSLYEGDWDYLIDGFTIYPLIFNEVPKTNEKSNAFGLSDIVPMIPQLKELSLISSAMLRHRKRAGTLLIAQEDAVSEGQASKIQNASDIDLVRLPNISEAVLRGFTPPALPQDFYNLRAMLLEDLMRVSGYNQLLGVARGVNTATESENIRMGAVLRQSEKVDIIEDFTVQVAKDLAGLIWQYKQNKKEIEEIIGEEVTEEMWPTLPEDKERARRIIQRELLFRIEAGSTRPPKDEAIEREQWRKVMVDIKTMFPNRLKDEIILPQLLKKYEFKDIDRAVIKYDDQEIQAAQQENQLLLQGIPQVVSPNENHFLHLQVHSQAYQTPGLQITTEMDKHLLDTQRFYEAQNPQVIAREGKGKTGTKPETGTADYADLVGAVRSLPGTGENIGGRR